MLNTNKDLLQIMELEAISSRHSLFKGMVYNGYTNIPFKYSHSVMFKCVPPTTSEILAGFEDEVVEQLIELSKECNVVITYSLNTKWCKNHANELLEKSTLVFFPFTILCDSQKAYQSFKVKARKRLRDMKYSVDFLLNDN